MDNEGGGSFLYVKDHDPQKIQRLAEGLQQSDKTNVIFVAARRPERRDFPVRRGRDQGLAPGNVCARPCLSMLAGPRTRPDRDLSLGQYSQSIWRSRHPIRARQVRARAAGPQWPWRLEPMGSPVNATALRPGFPASCDVGCPRGQSGYCADRALDPRSANPEVDAGPRTCRGDAESGKGNCAHLQDGPPGSVPRQLLRRNRSVLDRRAPVSELREPLRRYRAIRRG